MIFELSEWNLNLNLNYRASKILLTDTKLESISWELKNKNPLFHFCVGVWVGGIDTFLTILFGTTHG